MDITSDFTSSLFTKKKNYCFSFISFLWDRTGKSLLFKWVIDFETFSQEYELWISYQFWRKHDAMKHLWNIKSSQSL